MSFLQFSETQYIKTFDTGEIIRMGSFTDTIKDGEFGHIRVLLYVNGTLAGTEKIRINVYSDYGFQNKIFSSDWSDVPYNDWIGYIRCDFDRQNINKNNTYYLGAELDGYSRSGTNYIGLSYDFPYPIYDNSEDIFYDHSIAFQLFMYVEQ
jgi:hypothetical protein